MADEIELGGALPNVETFERYTDFLVILDDIMDHVFKARGVSDPKFAIFLILVQIFVIFQVNLLKILNFSPLSQ